MLVVALLAVLGSVAGVVIVSPLIAIALRHGTDDLAYDEETREAQIDLAIGQLAGITGAVVWYAGIAVAAPAALAAAALAWWLVPLSRATHNGLVALVPPPIAGAVVAAIAYGVLRG